MCSRIVAGVLLHWLLTNNVYSVVDSGTTDLYQYVQKLISRTVTILVDLLPIVLLAMLLVRIGEQFGLSDLLASVLAPVMQVVGLPAETGIVWAVTMLTGIYGGVGVYLSILPGLELSVAQHSILCSMMLFAHALPVEQVVVYRVGASAWMTGVTRVLAAISYGFVANWVCIETGFLSQAFDSPVAGVFDSNPDWLQWFADTFLYVIALVFIVLGLLVLMDILKAIGAIELLNRSLRPLLRIVGVESQLAPIATTGVLLGLVYGSALMLDEVRSKNCSARAVFAAMMLVCLIHALIEDTLVVMAIGANVWIVFIGRVPFALVFVYLAIKLSGKWQSRQVD